MRESPIRFVRLPNEARENIACALMHEFPSVTVERRGPTARGDALIDLKAWSDSLSFAPFDHAVEKATTDRLVLFGAPGTAGCASEVFTRYQRHFDRRTPAAHGEHFDHVLAVHRKLHDVTKPLVSADLDHALDAWQWLLRIAPHASLALQLAALFHDIERLESEADARVEHTATDYAAFKVRHARRGSDIAFDVLMSAGVDPDVATHARGLIASHEERLQDKEVALLNDADGLSFFSLNSAGYLDYFGAPQTRRKIAYTLARIGQGARQQMATVRLRPDVATLFTAIVQA